MNDSDTLFDSAIRELPRIGRGKVRDIYSVNDEHLLVVTTDRLSAYDVILPDPVPGKGRILTELSNFWFRMMEDIIPNHLTHMRLSAVVDDERLAAMLEPRSVIVRRLQPLPIEAVVRGYLIGSGWRDYQRTGAVCGMPLPAGLEQASRLPATLFTPATKAASGEHDVNISFAEVEALIGAELAAKVRDVSIRIYERAAAYALERGIIIADTKFEFGLFDEKLILIDEVLTPDSSRFWPQADYKPGGAQQSFDKQYLRDYLISIKWNKKPPAPDLPASVIQNTRAKYLEAMRLLTGRRDEL